MTRLSCVFLPWAVKNTMTFSWQSTNTTVLPFYPKRSLNIETCSRSHVTPWKKLTFPGLHFTCVFECTGNNHYKLEDFTLQPQWRMSDLMLHPGMNQSYLSVPGWLGWWRPGHWFSISSASEWEFSNKYQIRVHSAFCVCVCVCWTWRRCLLDDTTFLYLAQRHAPSCGFFCSCHQPQPFISLPQDLFSSTNCQCNYGYEKLGWDDRSRNSKNLITRPNFN